MSRVKRSIQADDLSEVISLFHDYEQTVYGNVQTSLKMIRDLVVKTEREDKVGLWVRGVLKGVSFLTHRDHRLPSLVLTIKDEGTEGYIEELIESLIESGKRWKAEDMREKSIVISANTPEERIAFEKAGFSIQRHWHQMSTELTETAVPVSPYLVRPFIPGNDERALYEAYEEIFADHYDYHPSTWEEFNQRFFIPEDSTDRWLLMIDKEKVIGFVLSRADGETKVGEITHLGMKREYRRMGLGLQLLRHSFDGLHRAGMTHAALLVDSDSPTHAALLYKKAGMTIQRTFTRYDLPL
ncbi:GNAT family N-acetyltransferase [Rossellomorea marisflavi]|uniref:GNAT family N-acetyltransferase n=1 Tax=Rossellomorea marisflavi TaxID=189381 RepID=UPI00345AAF61